MCHRLACLAVIASLCSAQLTSADPTTGKATLPVPSAADRGKAEKTVRELFKSEFARPDSESRRALSAKLRAEAAQGNDAATQFVLLQDAKDLASAAGDAKGAFAAIDALAAAFDVDALELKTAALSAAMKSASSAADAAALTQEALSLADDATAAGHFDAAAKLAAQAEITAKASKDLSLYGAAQGKVESTRAAARESQKAKAATEKLQQQPDDPDANLTVGKMLCFVQGDWAGGLPHLARGSDHRLASVAQQDLKGPTDSEAEVSVADAWWGLSQEPKNDAKSSAARRAIYWFRKAIPDLTGLKKIASQKRLWAASRFVSGTHVAAYKFATDPQLILLPLNDPSRDVLTLTQDATTIHISGEKTFDVATIAGKTRGHCGKAVLLNRTEAGGSLRAAVIPSGDHTYYYLLMTDKRDETKKTAIPLDLNVNYSWQVTENDDKIVLTVLNGERSIAETSLPVRDFKSFGFGVTVRWPSNKADITLTLD